LARGTHVPAARTPPGAKTSRLARITRNCGKQPDHRNPKRRKHPATRGISVAAVINLIGDRQNFRFFARDASGISAEYSGN
jgi:hypothetical protein